MAKKKSIVVAIVIVLGGAFSIYLNFGDWFQPKSIQIHHTMAAAGRIRQSNPRAAANAPTGAALIFGLDRRYQLTSIKVVERAGFQTNPFAPLLWNLVSDSNSIPVKGFFYGQRVPGMRPPVRGSTADPLTPGVTYRLLVEAGSLKGQHDFEVTANPP